MENLDLKEILKNTPKGTKLYSTTHGNICFSGIGCNDDFYPIHCYDIHNSGISFTKEGKWHHDYDGECCLFPSKDQHDWSKFDLTKTGK